MKKKIMSVILASAMLISMAGCGGKETAVNNVDLSGPAEENTMPISEEPITITYWTPLYGNIKSYNDNEMFKKMEEITGIHIEFVSPPKGQENEQYGVMLASDDLPDIIDRQVGDLYPGGLERGVEEGFFLDLSGYIDKYAPNIKKLMEEDDYYRESMTLENGKIGAVREIMTEPELPWQGPIIRQDLLDKIGAEVPRTPDELYEVLKKFKNDLDIKYPMVLDVSSNHIPSAGFASGWNVGTDMYWGEDEQYHYGPYEESYTEMLTDLKKWYEEGLIDPEFATRDEKDIEAAITNGEVGFFCNQAAKIPYYEATAKSIDSSIEFTPIPYLVPEKGDTTSFILNTSRVKGSAAAICATTEYPVECMKLLDFMYSAQGSEMCNFGIEGLTYEKDENGNCFYTDFFNNNPEGIDKTDMTYLYARNDGAYLKKTFRGQTEEEKANNIQNIWLTDAVRPDPAPECRFTEEQNDEMTTYWQDINTYVPQYITKTIMGMEDADSYETYVQRLKDYGMDTIISNFNEAAQKTLQE